MAKVLNSISLDAPAAPVTANISDTFAFTGTPGFGGGGGVQRYDFKWEVDDGGGFVTIGASGTGLITADTNPLVNSNSQTANSITVTCDQAGSYTIRMAGAPTSGGSYTVLSATQTVEVSAPANVTVTPGVIALTLATFAAVVIATANVTVTPTTKALSLTTFAPAVTATQNQTVTPTTRALSLTTFAPTVTGGAGLTVTPTTAALTTAMFAPTVAVSDHKTVTPTTVALVTSAFAPTVTTTAHQIATPTTAALVLEAFAPTVTGGAGLTVTPSTAALSLATFEPTVSATNHQTVTPGTATLTLAAFAPTVTVGTSDSGFESRIVIGQQLSDILLGGTMDFKFTTRNSSGTPTSLTGGAVAAYPGNSVAEITAGITLSTDWDGRTGLNNVEVAASSANGYATATRYALVMTAGTVDGVSVAGYVIAEFSVEGPVLAQILQAQHCLRRKRVLDPATGIFTIYDTDGTTPLFTAQTYKDAAGTQPYDGSGRVVRTEELA